MCMFLFHHFRKGPMIQSTTAKTYNGNIRNFLGYLVKYHDKSKLDLSLSLCDNPTLLADYFAFKLSAKNTATSLSKLVASFQWVSRWLASLDPDKE